MKTVRITGSDVVYPKKCACCLKPSSGTLEVRKEDLKRLALAAVVGVAVASDGGPTSVAARLRSSRAVQVPYCPACLKHVSWARMKGWVGVGLNAFGNAFLGLMAGGVLATLLEFAAEDPKAAPSFDKFVIGGALVGVAIALSLVRLRPSGRLGREHGGGDSDAIEIASFSPEGLVLRCRNNAFATELVASNPGVASA